MHNLPTSLSDNIRILIVDDSDDFRHMVMAYLKNYPFEVNEAEDGLRALELMQEQPFDIVLMDNKMPLMDGVATTRLFREWEEKVGRKHLLIVALSAFTNKQDLDDFFTAGCDHYIPKPIKKSDLIDALCKILEPN